VVISSPELKAKVSFSDHPLSVVRPSDVFLLDFYIFDFFSRTIWLILTKVGTNHPLAKGIQNYSNEEQPHPQREIIAKE
jgi:hypothetical protein